MTKRLKATILIIVVLFFVPALLSAVTEVGTSKSLNLTIPSDKYLFGFSSDDAGSLDISGSSLSFSYNSHAISTGGYSYTGKVQFSVYWKVASRLNVQLILDNVPEGLTDGNSTMKFIQGKDGTRKVLTSGSNTVATINSADGIDFGVANYSAFISMEDVKYSSSSSFTASLTLKVVVI